MIKKVVFLVASCFLASILFLSGCGGTAEQKSDTKIKLKLAHSFPESHYLAKETGIYWAEKVKQYTNGKVDFQYYPAEQMGKADALLDVVKNKVVDVAYVGVGYFSDKMPLSSVGQLPGNYVTSLHGSKAYSKVVNEVLLEKEFLPNNVRPVFATVLPPYQIVTVDKKINSISDIKGLKLRSAGIQSLIVEAVGGTPVNLPATEIFTGMQRKTLDGTLLPFTSFKPYQVEKIVKYSTSNVNMGSFAVTYCINEQVWKTLPKDVQDAMIKAGKETVEHSAKYQDDNIKELADEFKKRDINIYEVDKKTLDEMNSRIRTVNQDWAGKLDKKGLAGTAVLRAFEKAIEEVK